MIDIPVRVAAGSFVAFATLGLAALSTTKASDAAQVRLLGTALGMAAFMLPWPMKSLVGVLRAAEPLVLGRLQRYLVGAGLLCVLLMAAAGTTTEANPFLLCAGMALLFLNFQVVERWNVADGRLGLQACIAMLATIAALFVYRINPAGLLELPRSAFAILLGCAVYGILSQRLLPSGSNGRGAALGLWSFSVAAAGALTWSQR